MNSDEYKDGTAQVRKTLYSNSLRQGNEISGHGTAIYVINGAAYVYYGDYVNGKRQGSGLWYLSDGEGQLTKYTLKWENDVPNGEGKIERYSTIVTVENHQVVGESKTKESHSFTCINGILDGEYREHGEVFSGGYTFDMTIQLVNGYAVPLYPGEYPAKIDRIRPYPSIPLAGWCYSSVNEVVALEYSSRIWTIDGFGNCVTSVSAGTKELNFE